MPMCSPAVLALAATVLASSTVRTAHSGKGLPGLPRFLRDLRATATHSLELNGSDSASPAATTTANANASASARAGGGRARGDARANPPEVETTSGRLVGRRRPSERDPNSPDTEYFLGVPFAEPPLDDLVRPRHRHRHRHHRHL